MTGAFTTAAPIILASGSPRRRELLASAGLDFRVLPSGVEEPDPAPGEAPEAYGLRLARLKARDVAARNPGSFVLAADTVVAVDAQILNKPVDAADARRMLGLLAGREHRVVSACCLVGPDGATAWEYAQPTLVRFAPVSAEAIAAYVRTGECMDKAGGYAIQGLGAFMIESIQGSYTNVVGLPLAEVVEVFKTRGAIAPRNS